MGDVEAITQLLHTYALAVDAQRWELFDEVFTTDVQVELGATKWADLTSWKSDFAVAHRTFDATTHGVVNVNVKVGGSRARALSQGMFSMVRRSTPGGTRVTGGGWYDDELTRTDGGWKIFRRNIQVSWIDGNPAVMFGFDRDTFHTVSLAAAVAGGEVGFFSGDI